MDSLKLIGDIVYNLLKGFKDMTVKNPKTSLLGIIIFAVIFLFLFDFISIQSFEVLVAAAAGISALFSKSAQTEEERQKEAEEYVHRAEVTIKEKVKNEISAKSDDELGAHARDVFGK